MHYLGRRRRKQLAPEQQKIINRADDLCLRVQIYQHGIAGAMPGAEAGEMRYMANLLLEVADMRETSDSLADSVWNPPRKKRAAKPVKKAV